MSPLLAEHYREQFEAVARDQEEFSKEWSSWPIRLQMAGMTCCEIEILRVKCWRRFLEGRGITVDGSGTEAY